MDQNKKIHNTSIKRCFLLFGIQAFHGLPYLCVGFHITNKIDLFIIKVLLFLTLFTESHTHLGIERTSRFLQAEIVKQPLVGNVVTYDRKIIASVLDRI